MKNNVILLILFVVITGCSNNQSEENIYSLLVSKNGELVKENYFNGKQNEDLFNVQSVTKSIVSLLVGIAIEKGAIKNENVPIHNYFPDSAYFENELKKNITIQHLLNHTSGLTWKGYLEHSAFVESNNASKYVMEKEMVSAPGEIYNYNSGGTHLLSIILTKATGMSTLEFAQENLFKPLGIESIAWSKLNDGYYDGAGFGLNMRSEDLIKIGRLVLNKGKLNNRQLISKDWIDKIYDDHLKKDTKWGLRKSKHGYGWYSKVSGDMQIVYAMGFGGQFIFILPYKDMVVVSTHNHDTPNGIDQQIDFIKETLNPLINHYSN